MKKFTFGGEIEWDYDDYSKIFLIQPDGLKIDIIERFEQIVDLSVDGNLQVNYHISDVFLTEQELKERLILSISGATTSEYTSESYYYSSWTNGTDYNSTLEIGGHNLFLELEKLEGKYAYFEVNISS